MAALALSPALQAAESGDHSTAIVVVGALTALTLVFAIWVTLIWWTRRWILERLKQVAIDKTRSITSHRLRRISLKRIFQLARLGTRIGSITLMFVGFFVWATCALEMMPRTNSFAIKLEHVVYSKLEALALAAVGTIPDLCVVALIYFLTHIIHETLNHYFRSIIDGEHESNLFDPVTADTTRRLANLGIWIAAIIIAFPYIPGSDSAAFRGISVLAGLMISLGSANLVGQFASGLALIYGRAVRPGEYIETGQTEGTVEHIGLFACSLRTIRDEIIVLPHTAVSAGLKNYSRGTVGVRCAAVVTIGYDVAWRQVHALLTTAAERTHGIRKDPAPTVRQASLDDFSVRYELLFTPEDSNARLRVLGNLHAEIQDRFHEAGVQIMSPHYNADPAAAKIPPGMPA